MSDGDGSPASTPVAADRAAVGHRAWGRARSSSGDDAEAALFEAAAQNDRPAVRSLLAQRASPDAYRTRYGMTALMAAAAADYAEVCSLLLAAGADRSLRNYCNETAQEIARMCDRVGLLELLSPLNDDGESPGKSGDDLSWHSLPAR